jgi:hypothetical protein
MSTVFVDASDPRKPREISRDARDPQGDARREIERYADALSQRGRTVRVHVVGVHVKPWRKQSQLDIVYESHDGRATPDYRTVGA